jgi:hypothetical protein
MAFQKTWAASNNVDVVYGPEDMITPVIHHIGNKKQVDLVIELQNLNGKTIEKKLFENIELQEGRNSVNLRDFKFNNVEDGIFVIKFNILEK